MPKTKVQKQQLVEVFTDKLSRSKSVVFTDFTGMTMSNLSDLRNKLGDQGAEFTVTKNTLLDLALKKANLPTLPDNLKEGQTATLFNYEDEIAPLKILVKSIKDTQKGKIKGGIMETEFFDGFTMTRLSNLPGKLELRGQVVGLLNAPLVNIVGVLQANLRNLVYAVDQIRIKKGVN